MVDFGEHLKTKAFGQTVLPDMSLLIGQKLVEMPTLKNQNTPFQVIFKQHRGI